jgi:hypothetical protein
MCRTSTVVAALSVFGLVGLACSKSRVEGNIGDAALASGGQGGGTGGVCIVCIVLVGGTGGQCDASLSCNPGDIPVASDEDCLNHPDSCCVNQQCGQVITCRHGTDTDVDTGGSDGDSGTGSSAGYSHFPTFFPFCNPGDHAGYPRQAGFVCGIEFDIVPICCKKLYPDPPPIDARMTAWRRTTRGGTRKRERLSRCPPKRKASPGPDD